MKKAPDFSLPDQILADPERKVIEAYGACGTNY